MIDKPEWPNDKWPLSWKSRTVWWTTTYVLNRANLMMDMSISYNPEFSFLDENKMIVYLCFLKDGKYYKAIGKYKNNLMPTRADHPQDLFSIIPNSVKYSDETNWKSREVNAEIFEDSDRIAVSNAMKSFIYNQTTRH